MNNTVRFYFLLESGRFVPATIERDLADMLTEDYLIECGEVVVQAVARATGFSFEELECSLVYTEAEYIQQEG